MQARGDREGEPVWAWTGCSSTWFAHVPGLNVLMPATAADAKGLMTAAIRDDNPVLFFEAMSLSHGLREEAPAGEHVEPIGPARVLRPGRDVTVVAVGATVPLAQSAARTLAREGLEVEVVDLRSLAPWDPDTVVASVRRTGRLVIAHDAWVSGVFGAEVAATVAERALRDLVAPVARVGARPVPIPSGPLRRHALPNAPELAEAIRRVVSATAG